MTPLDQPNDHPSEPDGFPEEPAESAPRRAASAEFAVEPSLGSQALMREAMDPANQSLRDALRLSYRVLQIVILVLVVLFIFSGFKRVESGQSGVMLRWGRILGAGPDAALEPGLEFSTWPYPIGEFVVFEETGRTIDLGDRYWPRIAAGRSFEEAVQASSTNMNLVPERDGSVLTRGGDIAHLRLNASYDVDDPVRFVHAVENDALDDRVLDADRLVALALERSVVHAAAGLSLDELVGFDDRVKERVTASAQDLLDGVGSGIRLASIATPSDPMPPLPIRKSYGALGDARDRVDNMIVDARRAGSSELTKAAGDGHGEVVALIEEYETLVDLGDQLAAEAKLGEINQWMERQGSTGAVAVVIDHARSFRAEIDGTLGVEARRFTSLLDEYRKHPALVVDRLWMETYRRITSREDSEIIFVPGDVGEITIAIAGQEQIREIRRDALMKRKEDRSAARGIDLANPASASSIENRHRLEGRPGRLLGRTGRPLGAPESDSP